MATANIVPNVETQKNTISGLINKQLKKGDTWCLVDSKWYKQWKKYVGYDSGNTACIGDQSAHPGIIDNSTLFKEDSNELKENLIDELDYQVLPEERWRMLVSWYGLCKGQEPIARKVIELGMFVKHPKIEVYLMDLKLCQNSSLETPPVIKQFSREDTIDFIDKTMKKLFRIPDHKETRLWNKYMSNTYEPLDKPNTIECAGLYQGQVIVIEIQNDDGSWSRQTKHSASSTKVSVQQESKPKVCKSMKEGSIKQKPPSDPIEEMITCVICFSIMTNPCSLPCLHSFCDSCLKKLKKVDNGNRRGVSCPTCREFAALKDFRSDFKTSRLIDLHNNKDKIKLAATFCPKHPDDEIQGMCTQCQVIICCKCKFLEHDIHPSKSVQSVIGEVLPKTKSKISELGEKVDQTKKYLREISNQKQIFTDNVIKVNNEVQQQRDRMKEDIDMEFQKIMVEIEAAAKNPLTTCSRMESSVTEDITSKSDFVTSARKLIEENQGVALMKVLQNTEKICNEMLARFKTDEIKNEIDFPMLSFEGSKMEFNAMLGKLVVNISREN